MVGSLTVVADSRGDTGGAVGVFAGDGNAEHSAGRSADVLDFGQRPCGDAFHGALGDRCTASLRRVQGGLT